MELLEDLNQPSLFDFSYWIWKRRRFKLTLLFPEGIHFRPDRLVIVETPTQTVKPTQSTFAVIVHGERQDVPSQEAVKLLSSFDAYLPTGVNTIGIRLLAECQNQSTWLKIT